MRTSKTALKRFALSGLLSAATVVVAIAPISHANAHSINEGLLKIERIDQRIKSMDILLDNAAKSTAIETGKDVSEAEELLRPLIDKAFAFQPVMDDIQKALGRDDPGGDMLYAVALRLEDSRKQVDKAFKEKDQTKLDEIEARLKAKQAELEDLANRMAGQDLAAQTAFLGEVIRLSLHSYFSDNQSDLRSKSLEDLKRTAVNGLEKLHSDGVYQGQFDQRVARHSEQMGTVLALANLSDTDLQTIADFYKSADGQAKTKALSKTFDDISLNASEYIVTTYWKNISDKTKK